VTLEPPFDVIDSPLGPVLVAGTDAGLHEIRFLLGDGAAPAPPTGRDPAALADATGQLRAYFAGELTVFDLPRAPTGTLFQRGVWEAVAAVPFGQIASYGQIARTVGRPNASRAVGAANGANPLPIVVPCHRIVGSTGTLTGFRGGIRLKRWLLQHEGSASLSLFD